MLTPMPIEGPPDFLSVCLLASPACNKQRCSTLNDKSTPLIRCEQPPRKAPQDLVRVFRQCGIWDLNALRQTSRYPYTASASSRCSPRLGGQCAKLHCRIFDSIATQDCQRKPRSGRRPQGNPGRISRVSLLAVLQPSFWRWQSHRRAALLQSLLAGAQDSGAI